jgi:hypothetical protein
VATEKDKQKERLRYEQYSVSAPIETQGSASIPPHLRAPYLLYESMLQSRLSDQTHVLELGAGTGVHSGIPKSFGTTTLLDISHSSVHVNLNTPPTQRTVSAVILNYSHLKILPFTSFVGQESCHMATH